MILSLVLQGFYAPNVSAPSRDSVDARRLVPVDLGLEAERREIQRFRDETTGTMQWGLGTAEKGWWRILEAYEHREPTAELHDEKYPVAYRLSEEQFSDIVEEANK